MGNTNPMQIHRTFYLPHNALVHYALISSVKYAMLHNHEFHEFFLVIRGKVLHVVNGQEQLIKKGTLVFIRSSDIHGYELVLSDKSTQDTLVTHKNLDSQDNQIDNTYSDFRIINISLSREAISSMFAYIGDPHFEKNMMNLTQPPCIHLPDKITDTIAADFNRTLRIPSSQVYRINAQIRQLVYDFTMRFYLRLATSHSIPPYDEGNPKSGIPDWLAEICIALQDQVQLNAGRDVIRSLSYRNYSHVCRAFRKYLDMTPTEYINNLRLNHAAKLLAFSDDNITNIAFDAGFENISHFCHLFRRRYGLSPTQYRKEHHQLGM